MTEDLNIDNIDVSEIEEETDINVNIIPDPNYAIVSDINYDEEDENANYHNKSLINKNYYAVGVPCMENKIVNKIRSELCNNTNLSVIDVEHTDVSNRDNTHLIIRYKSTQNKYMSVAQSIVDEYVRNIRNNISICEEYKPVGSEIKDKVGRSNLRYIY